ncbi:MAG: hypothetical protein ACXVBQ_17565, partial [Pseudobdellovibrionaceae bacterium]
MTENLDSDRKKTSNLEGLFTLKLSGRYFNKGFNISQLRGLNRSRIQTIYSFFIDLDINPDFLYCDLKDEIELFKRGDIVFTGIIKDSLIEGKKAKLI